MFVGDTVPFDLLLGRPWQIRNKVTIDERRAGTYLVFKDDQDVPRYEVRVPPEAFFQRSVLGKKKVQVITVIQPPLSPTTKDTEELEKLLQEPDYSLPIDSLIQVSTHETKWIEDSIDPLSKIIADGRTAEEREILEKSKKITLTLEERDKELS